MDGYLTVPEAARRLAVCPATIRSMVKDGRLPGSVRLKRQFRIPAAAIDRFGQPQQLAA